MDSPRPEIESLRQQIAALERRAPLASAPSARAVASGSPDAALADLLALPGGLLHEVFAAEPRHAGAALGFTLGLARTLLSARRQALFYLQLLTDAQELGLPYGLGLTHFGLDAASLVICRVATLPELLWATEEALACRAVAGVVLDVTGQPATLDFTVSRRLGLRAAASGASAFVLRYGPRREASAAQLRWGVAPAQSDGRPFDAAAPGPPRYRVDIEKHRLAARGATENRTLTLDWIDNGFVAVDAVRPATTAPRRHPAPSRPQPAALGHRLSEAS